MTVRIQFEPTAEITRCRAHLEVAIGVTLPTRWFQRTRIPPDNPKAGIAAQFHLFLRVSQKRWTLSVFALVSKRQRMLGLIWAIVLRIRSIVLRLEIPLQFQQNILKVIIKEIKSKGRARRGKLRNNGFSPFLLRAAGPQAGVPSSDSFEFEIFLIFRKNHVIIGFHDRVLIP